MKDLNKYSFSVFDLIDRDFSPSTPEQLESQKKRNIKAREAWLESHPDATAKEAYRAGFKEGWEQFQLRKIPFEE